MGEPKDHTWLAKLKHDQHPVRFAPVAKDQAPKSFEASLTSIIKESA